VKKEVKEEPLSSSPFPPDIVSMFSCLKLDKETSDELMSFLHVVEKCADESEVKSLLIDPESEVPDIIKSKLPRSKHAKFNNLLTTMVTSPPPFHPHFIIKLKFYI
jgi:hypothetical protein